VARENPAMKKQSPGAEPPFGPPSAPGTGLPLDPCYLAWFERFNAGEYYEAHEALEKLWLQTSDGNHAFFKGLIQVAGAFVHLRKNFERPGHLTDAARLRPAARLFQTGRNYLLHYAPIHMHLDVAAVCALCDALARSLEASGFSSNPWSPASAPRIELAA
jgi:hypothetical protein